MERESFEDIEVAALLNQGFVSIKVDREERPDVDHAFMEACQALTGGGGWPLTAFTNAEGRPFFAGTYYPKEDRRGAIGLITLLSRIKRMWREDRGRVETAGRQIADALSKQAGSQAAGLRDDLADAAFESLKRRFDARNGGFGSAPKFPTPANLLFLLRYCLASGNQEAAKMAEATLTAMRSGGIYDQIGYGFSRYSTDAQWLAPHFEKMLYDNALLLMAYAESALATKNPAHISTVKEIVHYVRREMTSPEGGFYTAQDADSEGEEGKYYLWTPQEVTAALGDADAARFCALFDITLRGNFEGRSIPNLIGKTLSCDDRQFAGACADKLYAARLKRVPPLKDDKILTAWNGLMIAGMAMAGRVTGEESCVRGASAAADFILATMRDAGGNLLSRYRDGEAKHLANADDLAFMIWGLLELHQANFERRWLDEAARYADTLIADYEDKRRGGFFFAQAGADARIPPARIIYDGATPSANAIIAYTFPQLSQLTGNIAYEDCAKRSLNSFSGDIASYPAEHIISVTAQMISSGALMQKLVLVGDGNASIAPLLAVAREGYRPFLCVDIRRPGAEYSLVNGKAAAYLCRGNTCLAPITEAAKLKDALE